MPARYSIIYKNTATETVFADVNAHNFLYAHRRFTSLTYRAIKDASLLDRPAGHAAMDEARNLTYDEAEANPFETFHKEVLIGNSLVFLVRRPYYSVENVRATLQGCGISLRRAYFADFAGWCVNFRNGKLETAQYAETLKGALEVGIALASKK